MARRLLAPVIVVGVSVTAAGPAAMAQGGDPARGEAAFEVCGACHVVDAEESQAGPHLVGLFGRKAGTVADFEYSDAMKAADIVWDERTLDAYLADPQGYIPGNIMGFPGLEDEQERADVIAYLREVTAQ
jgi:cytochrome c